MRQADVERTRARAVTGWRAGPRGRVRARKRHAEQNRGVSFTDAPTRSTKTGERRGAEPSRAEPTPSPSRIDCSRHRTRRDSITAAHRLQLRADPVLDTDTDSDADADTNYRVCIPGQIRSTSDQKPTNDTEADADTDTAHARLTTHSRSAAHRSARALWTRIIAQRASALLVRRVLAENQSRYTLTDQHSRAPQNSSCLMNRRTRLAISPVAVARRRNRL